MESRRQHSALLTPRDSALLEFAAEHRLILAEHTAALLAVAPSTAAGRLGALAGAGYLARRRIFAGQPACFQITQRGLEVTGCDLPRPRLDLRAYAHDVGLAWVWLAARRGSFGPTREIIGERTMRSRDGRMQGLGGGDAGTAEQTPLGVRLGGTGARGRVRLHYPDLLLITPQNHRIAVELELSSKGRARRDRILAGYGSDPRVDAVLYLVDRPAVGEAIRSAARRLGLSDLVHVHRVRQPARTGAWAAPVAERAPAGRER